MFVSLRPGHRRQGITIIEVLTSIIVALIGVLGVMIMIPFAVRQAETGLDRDAATVVARNAAAQFEIRGYRNPPSWVTGVTGDVPPLPIPADPTFPEIFSIDPLAVSENRDPISLIGDYVTTTFPHKPALPITTIPPEYVFRVANLGTPTGIPMTLSDARRMFRTADELVFGDPPEDTGVPADLLGPVQYYNLDSGGLLMERQSVGTLSWSAIVVPVRRRLGASSVIPIHSDGPTSAWKYRMYILVYKDRVTSTVNPSVEMPTYRLDPDLNVGATYPVSNVVLEQPIDWPVDAPIRPIRQDNWVMLINRTLNEFDDGTPPSGVVYAEKGFDRQIAFYRVVGAADQGSSVRPSLTLDGPGFNFGDPNGNFPLIDPDGLIQDTYLVHLRNVVGVYERTFVLEGESNWNISF